MQKQEKKLICLKGDLHMSSSTIPYCAVEDRRRLNKCMEEASNDYEKEIYRKIRDMPVPYEKIDKILRDCRNMIISQQRTKKKKRILLIFRMTLFFTVPVITIYIYLYKRGDD